MGIINKNQTLYLATGLDTTGLYKGSQKALEIIRKMASQITSLDIFGEKGIDMGRIFSRMVADVYTFEKEFRKNMLEVATVSAEVSGNMNENVNQVVELTRRIPVSASDAAKALYEIVSAGFDGADGMKILEVATQAAVGGFTEATAAANVITTVLNAYDMSANKAEQVSDQLFATIRLDKTSFKDLSSSMAEIAPVAASYGVEISQVLAAFALLTKSGRSTTQAVTQIKAVLESIPVVLGNDAFDNFTFQEALNNIAVHANNSESALRALLPTTEAFNGVLGLTGMHANSVASNLNVLHNSTGATAAAFQQMLESMDNQMSLLANNIYAVLRPLGTNLLQEASTIAQAFNEAFADGRVEAALKHLGDLVVIVGSAFVGYKGAVMATTLAQRLNMAVLQQAVLERQLEKAALLTTGGAYNTLTNAQLKQIATKKLLVSAVKNHTAAMLKNTAAVLTNPYVLAAAAVAVLGYAFYKSMTQMSAAEQAQKQLNEEQQKAIQWRNDQTSQMDELTAKINNETESVYAQVKAYKELVKLVPELKGMTFEEFKAMPQSQQKALLNKIAEKNEMEEAEKKYSADLNRIEQLKNAISQTALLPNSGFSLSKLNEQLEIAQKLAEGHKLKIKEIKQLQWEANTPVEEKVQHYQELLSSLKKERDELNAQVNPVKVMASYAENLSDTWIQMPDLINRIRLDNLNKRIDEATGKVNSWLGKEDASMLIVNRDKSYWELEKVNAQTAL
ncbi:MAG: phage tail tape measure protein, partial [Parabacteroides sp.]|nr:phage tail tape measure protein [Parabacteroides sp.]